MDSQLDMLAFKPQKKWLNGYPANRTWLASGSSSHLNLVWPADQILARVRPSLVLLAFPELLGPARRVWDEESRSYMESQ
jgi:hypothetical protein